jgi:hypothetical protein
LVRLSAAESWNDELFDHTLIGGDAVKNSIGVSICGDFIAVDAGSRMVPVSVEARATLSVPEKTGSALGFRRVLGDKSNC